MTASLPRPDETSPLGRERALDRLCDQFEQACRANHFPRIEDYLAQAPQQDHDSLLRELILLEVAYRRKNGLDVNLHEYQQRFAAVDGQWLSGALETPHLGDAAKQTPNKDSVPGGQSTGPIGGSPPASSTTPTKSTKADAENGSSQQSTGNFAQRIRCPHCHNPIVLVDDRPDEVLCPGCGSSFRLGDARHTDTSTGPRPLGKFQLLDRVGVGAFGAVWRARDTELDRIVALKIPHSGLLIEKDELERFHREARAAAQLRHPGIVTVHEVVTLEGLPTIVSDFVAGVPLKDFLETRKLTFRESAELVAQIAEALHYAHTRGLVHRDIKPANIMLEIRNANGGMRSDGTEPSSSSKAHSAVRNPQSAFHPKLLDFGLALRKEAEVTMTLDGHVIGTPAYMSPEQAAGKAHEADPRSDVYSLGAVLYELLCGELPFRGSRLMILQQVLWEDPRPPRKLKDRVPRDLETICLKCLRKEPEKRFQTAMELAEGLRRLATGEPIEARRVGQTERFAKLVRRNPVLAALTWAVAIGVAGGCVVLILMAQELTTAVEHTSQALTEEGRISDSFAAQALAEKMAAKIDRRWRTLEQAGDDPAQHQALKLVRGKLPGSPEQEAVQQWLDSARNEHPEYAQASWDVFDDRGTLCGRSPRNLHSETDFIGKNYAHRDFFNGVANFSKDKSAPPLKNAHISSVFESRVGGARRVAFSVPVWDDVQGVGNGAEADHPRLGVIMMTVDLGHFAELDIGQSDDKNYFAILVDQRPDENGRTGAILQHPYLAELQTQEPREKDLRFFVDPNPFVMGNWDPNYADPVGAQDPQYLGRWSAVAAPVRTAERPEAGETGWLVVIQARQDLRTGPVLKMQARIRRNGLLGFGLVIALAALPALWLLFAHTRRWLSGRRV